MVGAGKGAGKVAGEFHKRYQFQLPNGIKNGSRLNSGPPVPKIVKRKPQEKISSDGIKNGEKRKSREIGAPTSVRPSINSSLPGRVTQKLPAGEMRTPAEVKQARNFFERNRDAAKQWDEQRTGKTWPDDATHFEHPRPIKDGGHPLFVEPGYGGTIARHMIPGPDGITDCQRWGRLGGRPSKP